MKIFTAIVLMLTFAGAASASKEGILAFSSFQVESTGIGSSGKVVVTGRQNEESQITALTISAFGKVYAVSKEKLAKLAGLPSNGVRISYEHGYPQLGGRTVYVQLQMGFTSFTRKDALITLTEDGKIEVSEIQIKKGPP